MLELTLVEEISETKVTQPVRAHIVFLLTISRSSMSERAHLRGETVPFILTVAPVVIQRRISSK